MTHEHECGRVVSLASHSHSPLPLSGPQQYSQMISELVTLETQAASQRFFGHASCLQLLVVHVGVGTVVRHPHPCSTKACPVPDYSWPETSCVSRGSQRSLSLTRGGDKALSEAVVPNNTCPVMCTLSSCTVCDLAHSEEKSQQLFTALLLGLPSLFPLWTRGKGTAQ